MSGRALRAGTLALAMLGAGVVPDAIAQERRSGVPAARPAPDTATVDFVTNGVRVILRRNAANDVVAVNLYLLGGVRQVTAENAGIEPFLLAASERGTQRFPGDRARLTAEALGSTFVIEPTADWTMFGFRALRATLDSTWALFADRLMAPTLDPQAVELIRAQLLAETRSRRDSPDALVNFLADSIGFEGHPYGLSPFGTESSIARLTIDALREYRQAQIVTSRMLLVVVGNVDRAGIERLVRRTLGELPRGSYAWNPPGLLPEHAGELTVVRRPLPTNYLQGRFAGPAAGDWKDYQALRVATAILSGRLFNEIRGRHNLTYAVDASFTEGAISSGGIYITTVVPDSALTLIRREIVRLQMELVDPSSLGRLVQGFLTEYFLENETNAEQGDFLARAALYRGDYRAAGRFVDELRHVTPEDVRRVARRYIRNVRWAYVGNPGRITRERATGME
ncbi:MAG TPA: pitrilysin family protein [Gemmatimonadaceae bacterium]|nr:pitrilysin family protein [Gemmatimonadaceae bacterium]